MVIDTASRPPHPGGHEQEPLHAADADACWRAVLARDATADARFIYAVTSTGVYCRPTCPSRRPKRENVRFFADGPAAEAAGFRACRRCKPDGASSAEDSAAAIAAACRLIETAEVEPDLAALAAAAGLSPSHFHRRFKAVTGLTPKAWAAGRRAQSMRAALADPHESVTNAIYEAGYSSSSRFYESSQGALSMTPTAWRKGGEGADIRFAIAQCTLGAVLAACSDKGVCAVSLGDDPDALARELQDRFPNATLVGDDADFAQRLAQIIALVEAPGLGLNLPLDIRGTAFQQRVWRALQAIPAGETASYADIARRIGAPAAVRAVARACAANAIAVAIPCHRVVRTDGALSGYRWGVERKRALLKREAEQ